MVLQLFHISCKAIEVQTSSYSYYLQSHRSTEPLVIPHFLQSHRSTEPLVIPYFLQSHKSTYLQLVHISAKPQKYRTSIFLQSHRSTYPLVSPYFCKANRSTEPPYFLQSHRSTEPLVIPYFLQSHKSTYLQLVHISAKPQKYRTSIFLQSHRNTEPPYSCKVIEVQNLQSMLNVIYSYSIPHYLVEFNGLWESLVYDSEVKQNVSELIGIRYNNYKSSFSC